MKKIKIAIGLLAVMLFGQIDLKAQTIEAEKTYEISGKAKRGTLANAEFTGTNYVLTYVTKSTGRKMKFEIYTFDKEYNFVSKEEDELEFEKAKLKFKWFKFQKEEYTVEGLFVEPNMMGTLVLKRKRITHTFDPIFWGYRKKVDILEKVKPKTDDGSKLFYYTHAEDDNTGDVYILVGEKAKGMSEMKEMPDKQCKKMHVMRFNKDCDLVSDLPLDFKNPMAVAYKGMLNANAEAAEGTPSIGDLTFIFAPTRIKGMTKDEDPDVNNFMYVQVNNANKIVTQFNFKTETPQWRIDDLIQNPATNDLFFYGPCAEGKENHFDMTTAASKKLKAVQLLNVKNGKLGYLSLTNLDDFEAKLKTPPSQKKSPAYKGKRFSVITSTSTETGELIIIGQNFDAGDKGISYKDVLGFHFDNKGQLRSQYGIDILETNALAQANKTPMSILYGENTNNLYWLLQEIDGVNAAERVLTYGRIGKIDMSGATVSDFKMLGSSTGKKPEYFIDPNFPMLPLDVPSRICFFGSDKKEKNIWFCRVKFD